MIKIKKEAVLVRPQEITPSSCDLCVLGTLNPAAARLKSGDIILYVRVIEKLIVPYDYQHFYSPRCAGKKECVLEIDKFPKSQITMSSEVDFVFKNGTKRLTFISHFRKVILDSTGFKIKSIDEKPSFSGIVNDGELGVEDPRIVKIGDKYIMTYVTLSREGNISTSLAESKDCLNWERKGMIFQEQNKDVVLFPEKINGKYHAFNRPEGNFEFSQPNISLVRSKDLEYWGEPSEIHLAKKKEWDFGRVGAGPPPLKTKKGWLVIYHGVIEHKKKIKNPIQDNNDGDNYLTRSTYAVGAALLDLKNPEEVIAKSLKPIIIPKKDYEKGTFENKSVIFPTGLVVDENGKDLLIFSGGGDVVTTVKKVSLNDVMKSLKKV